MAKTHAIPPGGGHAYQPYRRAVIANANTEMKEYLHSGKLLFTFVL